MEYDIIGDVHGYAEHLEALLRKLRYSLTNGAYRHQNRKVIFLGDFIDRGPHQVRTVNIARQMVEADSAIAIMGNHELNAIAWYTPDADNPGEYLRPHFSEKYGAKNKKQHEAFLSEVEDKPALHREIIEWFLALPLWLELPELRVVHAGWHNDSIAYLKKHLSVGNLLTNDLLPDAISEPTDPNEKDTPEPTIFKAVEMVTKGPEIPLPVGFGFHDKDGHHRTRVRIKWWDPEASNYRKAALLDEHAREQLPEEPIPSHMKFESFNDKPTFFGHYWLSGTPQPMSSTSACVDYSIAQGGKLCAYRWSGEPELTAKNFVWVE